MILLNKKHPVWGTLKRHKPTKKVYFFKLKKAVNLSEQITA